MSRRAYRSARRRRRFGRYDPSPVLLVTEDDRTLYLGTASRMLWRYRSELAPFTAALCLLLCGAWAHSRHPGAGVPLAALTAASTAVVGLPPDRWLTLPGPAGQLGRRVVELLYRWPVYAHRAERLYAAAVAALGGAWLAAATRWGPGAAPLPAVLLLGTLAGGLPWWTHRRRRARVRVTRTIDAWLTFSDSIGLPGSRVVSATVDPWGWSGRLALRRGQTVAQAVAAVPAIESALAVRPGGVRVEPDRSRADRAALRVIETDPLANAVPWPGLPGMGTTERGRAPSILDPIELGVFEDGSSVLLRLAYRNALIGGIVGSGKSGVLNVLMAVLVACRDVAVWGIDLKGGMELGPWTACLGWLATTPGEAVALLRDATAVREHRYRTVGSRRWNPADDGPALIILIDEYAELPDEAKALADSLARTGRALMVNVIAATQRPTQETMGGGAIRAQMDVRISMRVRERRDTDLILGQGYWAGGWRPDQLDEPGKFLISDPENTIARPARGYLINDQQISGTATDHTGRQPVIPIPDNPPPPEKDTTGNGKTTSPETPAGPEEVLWEALQAAPPEGVPVAALITATGKGRTWVYARLREHAATGRAAPTGTGRGNWTATPPATPITTPPASPPAARRDH